MPFLALIPWRLVFAVLLAASLGIATYVRGYHQGSASVQAEWSKDKLNLAQKHADALAKALQVQQSLQASIDQAKKDRTNETNRINRAHADLINILWNRPEARANDAGLPNAAGAGVGGTGAGLARPDAEFLAGFASDAARLQSAITECRAGYQAAQERLDSLAGEVRNANP